MRSERDVEGLLAADEPPAFEVVRGQAGSAWFLTCDHAGNRLPRALGTLGLSPAELERHIAWDLGAAGLAKSLSEALDAFLILQTYSRLVIDCNRPPQAPSSIASLSEQTPIPGNRHLTPNEAEARRREIFQPYHDRIGAELDVRSRSRQPIILVALHRGTPGVEGVARPWDVGVLYHRDARLAGVRLEL